MKLANRLTAAALIAGVAASTCIPRTAAAQTTIHGVGEYSAYQVAVVGPGKDPNMPILAGDLPGSPIKWFAGRDTPQVSFVTSNGNATYLGFNDKGSWIKNPDDGHVYVWNLKERKLTMGAATDAGVPLDLKNPSLSMENIVANRTGHGSTGVKGPDTSGRNTPYIPPGVAGDGNAQYAGKAARGGVVSPSAGAGNVMGASAKLAGTGATIKAGVLTFTLADPSSPDNGKPVSYEVARSAMALSNPNAPNASGISGMWIGEDPKNSGNVVQFFVQDNGTVAGTVMSGMAAQAMKRMMMASPAKP